MCLVAVRRAVVSTRSGGEEVQRRQLGRGRTGPRRRQDG